MSSKEIISLNESTKVSIEELEKRLKHEEENSDLCWTCKECPIKPVCTCDDFVPCDCNDCDGVIIA
jgi:hypothetical protein